MTKEQKIMMDKGPTRVEKKKSIITKKRLAIAAVIVAAGIGSYYIGPKIVNKVQLARALKHSVSAV